MQGREPHGMQDGAGVDRATHSVELINVRFSKTFNTHVGDYKVKLKNVEGKTYQDICHNFVKIMENILEEVLDQAKPDDMIRFNVTSKQFKGDNINTKFQPRSQIAPDYIAAIIDRTMQSNDTIDMSDHFTLNIIRVGIPTGRGRRMLDPNMGMNLVRKRCAITGVTDWFSEDVRDDHIHCFAYALAIALKRQTIGYDRTRSWSRRRIKVREEVTRLHRLADVPPGVVTPEHYQSFQNILPPKKRLVVVNALHHKNVLYKGDTGTEPVPLIYYNNHYLPLTNIKAWFGKSYYCLDCEVGYSNLNKHKCKHERKCKRCDGKRCLHLPKLHKYCQTCFGMFSNPECYADHVTNGICATATTCNTCGEWFPQKTENLDNHHCEDLTCSYCHKIHKRGSECYITTTKPSHSNPRFKYIFYDFESYLADPVPGETHRVHKVNYAVAMTYCSDCGDNVCPSCTEIQYFSGLDGSDPVYQFCVWATSNPVNHNSVCIAHNFKGYDGMFVLDYLVTQGNDVRVTFQGGKILNIFLQNVKVSFIDSLSFLMMPLRQFTSTFQIPDKVKGEFPHCFNVPANYNYTGCLPALQYYDPDSMKPEPRGKLIQWHRQHENDRFVFAEELKRYCTADVDLLRAGCIHFRNSFLQSTGIDPFEKITIASTCMEVFRRGFLGENIIGWYHVCTQ